MERPEYSIARSCRNCFYFKNQPGAGNLPADGHCNLPQVLDKKAEMWPAHATGICAAHTWKARGRSVHKIAITYNMVIPEDTI